MTENDILDMIYESLPEDVLFQAQMYVETLANDGPEMYVSKDGECWRIRAERHPHPNGE